MKLLLQKKHTSAAAATIVLSLTVPVGSQISTIFTQPAIAQSNSQGTFTLPPSLKAGTEVKIDSSSSLDAVNTALKQSFEQKYAGTKVEITTRSTSEALQAVSNGQADLAGIGRALSASEKSAGLQEVSVGRHKIAIIVSPESPFKGNLTIDQFAKIFRGEVTNWKQVGGPDSPVQLVDRPETSDTRQSFPLYPVFQKAKFEAAANAVRVDQDSTDAVIAKLGKDGVSYAIAGQVLNNPKVRILDMHKTQPTNPKYPFSQSLGYAYKGPSANPNASAFLGFTQAPETKTGIENALAVPPGSTSVVTSSTPAATTATTTTTATTAPATTVQPSEAASPPAGEAATTPTASAARNSAGFNPWWLAPFALVPLIWWGLGRKRSDETVAPASAKPVAVPPVGRPAMSEDETAALAPPVAETIIPPGASPGKIASGAMAVGAASLAGAAAMKGRKPAESKLVLTSRGTQKAYAYWELPESQAAELKKPGSPNLALRLYDVTPGAGTPAQGTLVKELAPEDDNDLIVSLPTSDRNYRTELGYTNPQGTWISLAASNTIHDQPSNPLNRFFQSGAAQAMGAVGAMGAMGTAAMQAMGRKQPQSRMLLTSRGTQSAYAYWELPADLRTAFQQSPDRKLKLRLFDVTAAEGTVAPMVGEFNTEDDNDLIVPLPASDRDYKAEVGYCAPQGNWVSLAISNTLHDHPQNPIGGLFKAGAGLAAGAGLGLAGMASRASAAVKDAASNVKDIASGAMDRSLGGAETVIGGMGSTAETIGGTLRDQVGGTVQGIQSHAADLGNTAAESLIGQPQNLGSEIVDRVSSTKDQVAGAAETMIGQAQNLGSGILGSDIVDRMGATKDQVAGTAETMMGQPQNLGLDIVDRMGAAKDQVAGAAETMIGQTQNLGSGILDRMGAVKDQVAGAAETMIGQPQNLGSDILDRMGAAKDQVAGAAETMMGQPQNLGSGIVDRMGAAKDQVSNLGQQGISALGSMGKSTLGAAAGLTGGDGKFASRVVFSARSATEGYAYWELVEADQRQFKPLGLQSLKLRLYDVTGLTGVHETPRGVYQVDCQDADRDHMVSIPVSDRDYMVEIGYTNDDGRWVGVASSEQVHFSSEITRLL